MQVKEAVKEISKFDMDSDICVFWQTKPDNIDIYTWSWICDNFNLEMLREFNNIFTQAIEALKEMCPYVTKVASGDVVFVPKK